MKNNRNNGIHDPQIENSFKKLIDGVVKMKHENTHNNEQIIDDMVLNYQYLNKKLSIKEFIKRVLGIIQYVELAHPNRQDLTTKQELVHSYNWVMKQDGIFFFVKGPNTRVNKLSIDNQDFIYRSLAMHNLRFVLNLWTQLKKSYNINDCKKSFLNDHGWEKNIHIKDKDFIEKIWHDLESASEMTREYIFKKHPYFADREVLEYLESHSQTIRSLITKFNNKFKEYWMEKYPELRKLEPDQQPQFPQMLNLAQALDHSTASNITNKNQNNDFISLFSSIKQVKTIPSDNEELLDLDQIQQRQFENKQGINNNVNIVEKSAKEVAFDLYVAYKQAPKDNIKNFIEQFFTTDTSDPFIQKEAAALFIKTKEEAKARKLDHINQAPSLPKKHILALQNERLSTKQLNDINYIINTYIHYKGDKNLVNGSLWKFFDPVQIKQIITSLDTTFKGREIKLDDPDTLQALGEKFFSDLKLNCIEVNSIKSTKRKNTKFIEKVTQREKQTRSRLG